MKKTNRIFLLMGLLLLSCSDREMVNKELIGDWVLVEIQSDKIDGNKDIKELHIQKKHYLNNLQLKIEENSQYAFAMQAPSFVVDEESEIGEFVMKPLEEHGIIINENEDRIEWNPLFKIEGEKKSFNHISASHKEGYFNLTYNFGPLQGMKTNESRFVMIGDELHLSNDNRLSYNANKTEFSKNNKRIETKLVFKRKGIQE